MSQAAAQAAAFYIDVALLGGFVFISSCFGEGEARVVGTVTIGEVPGYSVDAEPNPNGRDPIPGARVRLFVDSGGRSCKELSDEQATAATADDGSFSTPGAVFGGCLFDGDIEHTLCVDHPDFEPFGVSSSNNEIWRGEKHVNLSLVARK